jgi:hypothetical protein
MPRYLLADNAYADLFSFTGICEPKYAWLDGDNGRRQRSTVQETDETGVKLWEISTTRLTENYGRLSEVVANVTVPSLDKPNCPRHQPAQFIGLTVDVRVNRSTNQLIENFSAAGLVE